MKLGELFVDLGVNSGSAFSTLSNFAFKFNNVADAANKMIKGLEHFGGTKPLADFSQNILDISRRLTISTDKIQGLRRAAVLTGTDFGNMARKLEEFEKERGSYVFGDRTLLNKYSKFGLDANALWKGNSLDVFRQMVNVINGIKDQRLRADYMAVAGFDVREFTAWQDYFKNQALYDNDKDNLTRKQLEDSEALNEEFRKLKTNVEGIGNYLASELTPTMTKFVETMNEFVNSKTIRKVIDKGKSWWQRVTDWSDKYGLTKELKEDLTYTWAGAKLALGLGLDENTRLGTAGNAIVADFLGAAPLKYSQAANLGTDLLTTGVLNAADWLEKTHQENNKYSSMKNMGLKGGIPSINSDPRILSQNVEKLKNLDNYLASRGYLVQYTSAMGGSHAGGVRSHASGNKVDFQLWKNGRPANLTPEEEKYLRDNGYFGGVSGAVGWEPHKNQVGGGHYDVSVAGGFMEDRVVQGKTVNIYNSKTTTLYGVESKDMAKTVEADNKDFGRQFNLGYEY